LKNETGASAPVFLLPRRRRNRRRDNKGAPRGAPAVFQLSVSGRASGIRIGFCHLGV